jgi:hypothetical protein
VGVPNTKGSPGTGRSEKLVEEKKNWFDELNKLAASLELG